MNYDGKRNFIKKPLLEDFGLNNETVKSLINDREVFLRGKQKGFSFEKHPFICFILTMDIFCAFSYGFIFSLNLIFNKITYDADDFLTFFISLSIAIIGCILWSQPVNMNIRNYEKTFSRYNEWINYLNFLSACDNYKKYLLTLNVGWWESLDGKQFERELAKVYRNMGFEVSFMSSGADGGIDLVLEDFGIRIAVQCKAHKKKISEGVARDLYGVMQAKGFQKGILATLNGASSKCVEFCKNLPIQIIDVYDIIAYQEGLRNKTS